MHYKLWLLWICSLRAWRWLKRVETCRPRIVFYIINRCILTDIVYLICIRKIYRDDWHYILSKDAVPCSQWVCYRRVRVTELSSNRDPQILIPAALCSHNFACLDYPDVSFIQFWTLWAQMEFINGIQQTSVSFERRAIQLSFSNLLSLSHILFGSLFVS